MAVEASANVVATSEETIIEVLGVYSNNILVIYVNDTNFSPRLTKKVIIEGIQDEEAINRLIHIDCLNIDNVQSFINDIDNNNPETISKVDLFSLLVEAMNNYVEDRMLLAHQRVEIPLT